MAIVSKRDPDPGAAPPRPGEGAGTAAPPPPEAPGDAPEGAPEPKRHNLPLWASPVVGRRAEFQRIAAVFDRVRRLGGPRRVEVVGPRGVGASSVAVELARRVGGRFPGGAWYVHLSMGSDLAWATLGAQREGKPVNRLADAATKARDQLGEDPKALLVLDGATSTDEAMAALPPAAPNSADVFLVSEKLLSTVDADQVCEVAPIPRQGAKRMAESMLRRSKSDAAAPPVRSLDGLAVTASLAARTALAYQGKSGPMSFQDSRSVMQQMVRLVARNPAALELLLLASVAHPVFLPVDVLFVALGHVRKGRGAEPTAEEIGQGVMWLAHAGILEPLDEGCFSMHPILQEIVHGMAQSPADLDVAREALVEGLIAEAHASTTQEGVDLPRAAPHQLRFLAKTASGEAKSKAVVTSAMLDAALGANGAGGS